MHSALLCLQLLAAQPASEPAPELVTGATDGPILALGLGYVYGGGGGALGYQIRLPFGNFFVTPRLGLGLFVSSFSDGESVTELGWNAGVTGGWGSRHRLIVDLGGGVVQLDAIRLYGTMVAQRPVYGITESIGYEFVANWGLFLRAEATFSQRLHPSVRSQEIFDWAFGLGVGYKLW